MNEITGRLIEIGDDGCGHQRLIIQTTREAILACDANLLYHDVTVRLQTTDEKLHELIEDVRAVHSPGRSPGEPRALGVYYQKAGEITGGVAVHPAGVEKFNIKHLDGLPNIGKHLVKLEVERIMKDQEINRKVNCPPWCGTCQKFHWPGEMRTCKEKL